MRARMWAVMLFVVVLFVWVAPVWAAEAAPAPVPVVAPAHQPDPDKPVIKASFLGGGVGNTTGSSSGMFGIELTRSYKNNQDLFVRLLGNPIGQATLSGKQSDFGAALLSPSIEGRAFYLETSYDPLKPSDPKTKVPWYKSTGWFTRIGVNWATWRDDKSVTADGCIISLSGGPRHLFIRSDASADNPYELALELGPAVRILANDLGSNSELLKNVLGADSKFYPGVEARLLFRLNQQTFYLNTSYFSHSISGFSGLRVYFGTALSINFVKVSGKAASQTPDQKGGTAATPAPAQ